MGENNGNGAPAPPQGTDMPPSPRPKLFVERLILTCSGDTLTLWREKCAEEILRLAAAIERQRGGIDQIDAELVRREAEKKERTARARKVRE